MTWRPKAAQPRRFAPASGRSTALLIILGLLLIAGSFVGVWAYGQRLNRTVTVVVVRRTVPPLSPVLSGEVAVEARPAASVGRAGAYRTVSAVVGKWVRYGLIPGQIVRPAMLASTYASASRFDVQITDAERTVGSTGLVAVPLALDEPHGFTLPAPGDHVDLLATRRSRQGSQAQIVLQHVLVLDVLGQGTAQRSPTPAGLSGPQGAAPATAQQGVLVLALTPAGAETLALAQAAGGVTLLLQPLNAPASGALPAPVAWASVFPAAPVGTGNTAGGAATGRPAP